MEKIILKSDLEDQQKYWKHNRKVWVNALRSGKYQQTIEFLGIDLKLDGKISHCCLGVGAEICGLNKGILNEITGVIQYGQGEEETAPEVFMNAVGLRTSEGSFAFPIDNDFLYCHSLVDYNDNGLTFDQIADIIEYEPTGLFEEAENG
jgi:hypothetical protein